MNNRFWVVLLAAGMFLSACHHGRKLTGTGKAAPALNSLAELQAALQQRPSYKWVQMRSSISIQQGDNKYPTASTFLKLRQDSLLWASVSVLFEIAKARLNSDSAVVLNRPNKTYSVYTFKDMQRMLAMQNLSLKALQNLIFAFPPFGINTGSKFTIGQDDYTVNYQGPTYRETIIIDKSTQRMKEYRYERNASEYVDILYNEFREENGQMLPHKITLDARTPDKILVDLKVSEYTFLPSDDAPLNIPASYTKED